MSSSLQIIHLLRGCHTAIVMYVKSSGNTERDPGTD